MALLKSEKVSLTNLRECLCNSKILYWIRKKRKGSLVFSENLRNASLAKINSGGNSSAEWQNGFKHWSPLALGRPASRGSLPSSLTSSASESTAPYNHGHRRDSATLDSDSWTSLQMAPFHNYSLSFCSRCLSRQLPTKCTELNKNLQWSFSLLGLTQGCANRLR